MDDLADAVAPVKKLEEFITEDFSTKQFNRKFDICVAMGVLDYIPNPPAFLGTMMGLARERILVSFPSNSTIRGPLRKIRYRLKKCPLYLFDRRQIEDIVNPMGDPRIIKIPGHGMDFFVDLTADSHD